MFENKFVLMLVLAGLLLFGCINNGETALTNQTSQNGELVSIGETAQIETALSEEGIDFTQVEVTEKTITITYSQPVNAEPEEAYATWAFIFGSALDNAPNANAIESLVILCEFEDGEKIRVTSSPENARGFLNGKIGAWDFLYNLGFEPLTQGPQIWEG